MTRRKKLLRLGLKPKKIKSREERKYEKMLAEIADNVKKRKKDKNYQQKSRKEWITNYASNFPHNNQVLSSNWMSGSTAKKSIFEPVRLDNLDLEEINAKRKENNINTPIEQAAKQALGDAKEKAKRVAIICHKSGYQYIGENEDAKNFGKKTQEMEV